MSRPISIWLAAFTVCMITLGAALAQSPEPADFVLQGGKVYTLDAKETMASAVAIRDERIVFVGSDEEAKKYIGQKTEVYDAAGRTVIPGLNETHVHPTGAAQGEANQPFTQLHSIGEIQDWVRQQVATTPSDKWIRLPRVDVTRIKERRMPTPADLDAAAGDRPAVFVWQYANRQVQVLNRAALRAANITRDTAAPNGGKIIKDASGEPTGMIEDAPSLTSKWLSRASVSHEDYLASLEKLLRLYNRCGITSITDRSTGVDGWKAFRELAAANRLPVRTTVTIRNSSDGSVEGTERYLRGLPFRFGEGDDWVKIGPLKIGVDGGVLYGTAYMREPYGPQSFDLYGLDDPQYRGLLQMNAEKVTNVIRTGHRLGWQMCSHVTGDAGVDMVLDAVEAANADSPIAPRRYTLIHAYFAHSDTAARCRKLGVCIDTQPAWLYKDGDALAAALGTKRMEEFIGLKTWQDAGLKIAINSDHMQGFDPDLSLNPYNPFIALYTAVTRKTESGAFLGKSQAVSRKDALRMLTGDAAWLHFDETKKGTLERGKFGDLAVLSADYFSCPEEQIKGIRSALTVVGGKVVHRAAYEVTPR
jgi:predicted amidohydrolase YtcJ